MSLNKFQIAQRISKELKDGYYVNLGIGIPTLVANYIPNNISVVLQSENGLLGMGPFPTEDKVDPDLINAGKQTITTLKGSVLFDSSESFSMIRGGLRPVSSWMSKVRCQERHLLPLQLQHHRPKQKSKRRSIGDLAFSIFIVFLAGVLEVRLSSIHN